MTDGAELRRVTKERDLAIERLVLMCKATNLCMWDLDIRANVGWYSDAIYTVYGIDPTITPSFERWTTYVHPDDRERVVAGFRNVVENGKSEWAAEYRFVRPNDGNVLEVFDRGFVMLDEGQPVRIVGVVMDVTQQRALERQLRHAQKMQAKLRLEAMRPEDERETTPTARAAQRTSAPGKETILLVEDDGGVRRALSTLLKSHGFAVLAVDSGAAALAAWETAGRIDLVITDLMMPEMNGRELAAALSARRSGLAILIISGHRRDLDPSLTASYEFLHKPFDGESLLAAVRGCLDRARDRARVESCET